MIPHPHPNADIFASVYYTSIHFPTKRWGIWCFLQIWIFTSCSENLGVHVGIIHSNEYENIFFAIKALRVDFLELNRGFSKTRQFSQLNAIFGRIFWVFHSVLLRAESPAFHRSKSVVASHALFAALMTHSHVYQALENLRSVLVLLVPVGSISSEKFIKYAQHVSSCTSLALADYVDFSRMCCYCHFWCLYGVVYSSKR